MPRLPLNHDSARSRDRLRHYETARREDKAFYSGTAWRKARDLMLSREPFCRICAATGRVTTATEVDHIVPLRRARESAFDAANLQPLCAVCHARKTRRETATQPADA